MENRYSKETVIETNINTLMEILEDSKTPQKVRVAASDALLAWLDRRQNAWDIDL